MVITDHCWNDHQVSTLGGWRQAEGVPPQVAQQLAEKLFSPFSRLPASSSPEQPLWICQHWKDSGSSFQLLAQTRALVVMTRYYSDDAVLYMPLFQILSIYANRFSWHWHNVLDPWLWLTLINSYCWCWWWWWCWCWPPAVTPWVTHVGAYHRHCPHPPTTKSLDPYLSRSHLTPRLADAQSPVRDARLRWRSLNTLRSSPYYLLMLYWDKIWFSEI